MATKQSTYFKGNARTPIPVPNKAGVVCEVIITHTFTEAVADTDVLELAPLAAGNRILAVDVATENLGAITLDVGFMSGTPGDVESARSCGAELFNDQAAGTPAAKPLIGIVGLAVAGEHRSIGVVPSAAITPAANKKLHLRLRYASA
ncbi:hypothetical protein SAMN05421774_10865 [Gemmobacter megaterium]|uniref:Bacteriophage lambda head decoration protein D n=1 Tax=Gemmobacter megaterium TaxID=1086013 RepID=A0A1N7QAZ1_9RHOB|nr:hypothetical protein [Gemmobacter megaterium]GGE24261.1 hypothetical protein GCM10011345_32800 [Gemmobacter megaterium]SIT20025.1 hypothetical protein SAMN05421774_10865 [Gemmobacter megaterium]